MGHDESWGKRSLRRMGTASSQFLLRMGTLRAASDDDGWEGSGSEGKV